MIENSEIEQVQKIWGQNQQAKAVPAPIIVSLTTMAGGEDLFFSERWL